MIVLHTNNGQFFIVNRFKFNQKIENNKLFFCNSYIHILMVIDMLIINRTSNKKVLLNTWKCLIHSKQLFDLFTYVQYIYRNWIIIGISVNSLEAFEWLRIVELTQICTMPIFNTIWLVYFVDNPVSQFILYVGVLATLLFNLHRTITKFWSNLVNRSRVFQ